MTQASRASCLICASNVNAAQIRLRDHTWSSSLCHHLDDDQGLTRRSLKRLAEALNVDLVRGDSTEKHIALAMYRGVPVMFDDEGDDWYRATVHMPQLEDVLGVEIIPHKAEKSLHGMEARPIGHPKFDLAFKIISMTQ